MVQVMKLLHTLFSFRYTTYILLASIVVLGLSLRLFRLDQAPYGALVDEMHFGYIADSLLETGKDEHGTSFPLIFKGFGDQKLPFYAYTLVPFVALFDLSVTTIRLPSVLFGTLSIILVFFLARKLNLSQMSSLGASLIVAISPWAFILSRFGFEANAGLSIFLAALLMLTSLQKKTSLGLYLAAGFSFGLTWYAYIAFRPVTLTLILIYAVYLLFHKIVSLKKIAILLITFFIVISPFLLPANQESNTARLKQIGIFSDQGIAMSVDEQRTFCSFTAPRIICDVLWNKISVTSTIVMSRYVSVFSPEFLALSGEKDSLYLKVEGYGQFMVILYPLFILGLFVLVTGKYTSQIKLKKEHRFLILLGLLVAPIPSILAGDPQKVRLAVSLPFFVLTMAVGSMVILDVIKSLVTLLASETIFEKYKKIIVGLVTATASFVLVFSTTSFLSDFYFIHTAKHDEEYGSYIRDLLPLLKPYQESHAIVIKPFFSDPIMYYAFYTQYPPAMYQQKVGLGKLESSGFQHAVSLGTITTSEAPLLGISCEAVINNRPTVVATNEKVDPSFKPLRTFTSANGVHELAFIYDAYTYGMENILRCHDLPLVEREKLNQEWQAKKPLF